MKEIKIQVTDDEYNRILRIIALDKEEVADAYERDCGYSEEFLINSAAEQMVEGYLDSGEGYWGKYEEDYNYLIRR